MCVQCRQLNQATQGLPEGLPELMSDELHGVTVEGAVGLALHAHMMYVCLGRHTCFLSDCHYCWDCKADNLSI